MKYGVIFLNIFGLVFSGIFLKKLFALSDMSNRCILLMVVFGFAAESIFRYLTLIAEKLRARYEKNRSIPAINGRENYVDSENYRKFTRK